MNKLKRKRKQQALDSQQEDNLPEEHPGLTREAKRAKQASELEHYAGDLFDQQREKRATETKLRARMNEEAQRVTPGGGWENWTKLRDWCDEWLKKDDSAIAHECTSADKLYGSNNNNCKYEPYNGFKRWLFRKQPLGKISYFGRKYWGYDDQATGDRQDTCPIHPCGRTAHGTLISQKDAGAEASSSSSSSISGISGSSSGAISDSSSISGSSGSSSGAISGSSGTSSGAISGSSSISGISGSSSTSGIHGTSSGAISGSTSTSGISGYAASAAEPLAVSAASAAEPLATAARTARTETAAVEPLRIS
jgi:hypothetical protein